MGFGVWGLGFWVLGFADTVRGFCAKDSGDLKRLLPKQLARESLLPKQLAQKPLAVSVAQARLDSETKMLHWFGATSVTLACHSIRWEPRFTF